MDFNFLNQKTSKIKAKREKRSPKFSGSILGAILIFMTLTALYLMIANPSANVSEISISDLAKVFQLEKLGVF